MNDHLYLLIGGDERQEYLYNILKNKNKNVEKIFLNETEILPEASKKICNSDVIILPFPSTKDGETIFAPKYKGEISLEFIIEKIPENSVLFIGGENKALSKAKAKKIINLLYDESLTLKNAMATAEAALSIIIENVNHTIFGAEILVIGYGRIGKILTDYLLALKGNITVCARKETSKTIAELSGANTLDIKNLKQKLQNYNIIINTVPTLVLKNDELKLIDKNALIIDLASYPGGVDFKSAAEIGIKTIHALALPGKYSPKSAAEFIEYAITNEMK